MIARSLIFAGLSFFISLCSFAAPKPTDVAVIVKNNEAELTIMVQEAHENTPNTYIQPSQTITYTWGELAKICQTMGGQPESDCYINFLYSPDGGFSQSIIGQLNVNWLQEYVGYSPENSRVKSVFTGSIGGIVTIE